MITSALFDNSDSNIMLRIYLFAEEVVHLVGSPPNLYDGTKSTFFVGCGCILLSGPFVKTGLAPFGDVVKSGVFLKIGSSKISYSQYLMFLCPYLAI